MVRSVLGEVELAHDRVVLPHEHLVINYGQKAGTAAPPSRVAEDECTAILRGLADTGVQAIVDCTPPGYGRDLDFLRQVSERSGMHIIAATGTFCEQFSPQPGWASAASVDALAEIFLAELDRSCGVIKVATSPVPNENEIKALHAAALAHNASGAPIVSHTSGSFGVEQVDLFEEAGVDLSKVVISHVCADDEPVEYALAIAKRGARVGFDRIGHTSHRDSHWVALIQRLITEGLGEMVLASHDSVQSFRGPESITGHTFSDIGYLTTTFHGQARAAGVSDREFNDITINNPLSWLASKRVPK